MPLGLSKAPTLKKTLSQLTLVDGSWNHRYLLEMLPNHISNLIMVIPPHSSSLGRMNLMRWVEMAYGSFNVSSAHASSLAPAMGNNNRLFLLLWAWPEPERTKAFLWKMSHNALPSNALHFAKGIAQDALCPVCIGQVESTIHILLDCPFSMGLWNSIFSKLHHRDD
ncbi:hypothetical protein GYH30_033812 [Glycine max]|nr:hypothetical protein GYH30_033812 [Glycine max]